jgi:hypothetical protein
MSPSIADLLLGNPVTLPDGKVWRPSYTTPEERERNARKAKAYRERHKAELKAKRDANPLTPEQLERKREASKRWAEKNRALLAYRKRQKYHRRKSAQRRAAA